MRSRQKARRQARLPQPAAARQQPIVDGDTAAPVALAERIVAQDCRILFDISDLILYIGYHSNLTGIQRLQAAVVLSLLRFDLCPPEKLHFISFDFEVDDFILIDQALLYDRLIDLGNNPDDRTTGVKAADARLGRLGSGDATARLTTVLDDGTPAVLCLLGAAWARTDYFERVLALKRRFGTRFAMVVHDLIPIYAQQTCDAQTARGFEAFLRRAQRHTDHFLCVSENTAKDLVRYARSLGLAEPRRSVIRNGSSFAELLPPANAEPASRAPDPAIPEPFVLFVSTIEGRKNHDLMFTIWRDLASRDIEMPTLVCVGLLGWKSENYIAHLVETNYLDGKIMVLQDVADRALLELYDRCLFTVFPSQYEGWGLPVGEALARGKICVLSDRASLPEVAGEFGVYIDIDDPQACAGTIENLIADAALRRQLEERIAKEFKPISWQSVARRVLDGCVAAAARQWSEPYPLPMPAYGRELSFGQSDADAEGLSGDDLFEAVVRSRKSWFVSGGLDESSFRCAEDARIAGKWGLPQFWGSWISYPGGEIALALPEIPCAAFYLFLRCHVAAPLRQEEVSIFVNGDRLWRGTFDEEPRDLCLKVYKRNGRGLWNLRLGIWAPEKSELYDALLELDPQAAAIGLHRLVVVPEDDLHTRIEILQNLLLGR